MEGGNIGKCVKNAADHLAKVAKIWKLRAYRRIDMYTVDTIANPKMYSKRGWKPGMTQTMLILYMDIYIYNIYIYTYGILRVALKCYPFRGLRVLNVGIRRNQPTSSNVYRFTSCMVKCTPVKHLLWTLAGFTPVLGCLIWSLFEPPIWPLSGACRRAPQEVKEVNLIDAPVADKTSRKCVAIGW